MSSASSVGATQPANEATPKAISRKSLSRTSSGPADLSSSIGSTRSSIKSSRSSRSAQLPQAPPYWNQHNRTRSNVSYVSVNAPTRRPPILLEDHTEEHDENATGLWAQGVVIDDYHVVSAGNFARFRAKFLESRREGLQYFLK
ncbi:MAG: hypothetical protein Q9159_000559 [Coniocarpon cinnabarinum]